MPKSSTGLDENIAGLLSYVAWWITGVIFLVLEKESKFVKFHAIQSIIISIIWIIAYIVLVILAMIPYIGFIFGIVLWLLWILMIVVWIVSMIKAYQHQQFKWPVVGAMAEKYVK
jgi:uncharacterized membrane protein